MPIDIVLLCCCAVVLLCCCAVVLLCYTHYYHKINSFN